MYTIYLYIKPFKDQRLLYELPGLTFIAFIYSVRFSEKAAVFPYASLIGFYNEDGVCLLRGTYWKFKYISGYFSNFCG
jgi:hypothetical protein